MTRFDDQFPGLLESEQDAPRTRSINPFEIALWVLGAALLLGGFVSLFWVAARSGQGQALGGDGYIATQMVWSIAPAAVTAGLFAIIVSLALRAALLVLARRTSDASAAGQAVPAAGASDAAAARSAESTQPALVAQPAPQLDPLQFAPPQLRSRRRTVDHSAYRRPPAE